MPTYNRYRTRGDQNAFPTSQTSTSPAGCSLAANTVVNLQAAFGMGVKETMLDVESGNWRKRRGKEFAFNDMLKTRSEVACTGTSSYLFTSIGNRCNAPVMKLTDGHTGSILAVWLSPCPHQATTITDAVKSSLEDEVWTDCLANRGKADANLLETLAEAGKTWKMLQTPFENLSNLIKTTRRNGKRLRGYEKVSANSKAFIQFSSSEWLRFRYGVMPIMSDVKAVMKALETGHPREAIVMTARSSKTINATKSSVGFIGGSLRCDYAVSTSETVKVKAYWYDRYQPSIWNDMGLNLQNLLVLPWELTRYSFVVDWFTNVGAVAYANAPRVRFESLGGQVVVRTDKHTFYVPTSFINQVPLSYTLTGSVSDTIRRTDVTIDRHSRPPTTNFVIRHDFKMDNWIRATDAITVAIQWLSSIGFARH